MTLRTPDWWAFVLLAFGVFRLARLAGWDDLTARLRGVLLMPDARYWDEARIVDEAQRHGSDPFAGATRSERVRFYLAKLVHCPWCGGFWIGVVAWACWLRWPSETLVACTPLAVSAIVGLVAKQLDP